MCAKRSRAQVGEHALADPGREVGLGDRGDPAEQRRRPRTATRPEDERVAVARRRCRVDRELGRERRGEPDRGADEERDGRQDRLAAVRAHEREAAGRDGGTCASTRTWCPRARARRSGSHAARSRDRLRRRSPRRARRTCGRRGRGARSRRRRRSSSTSSLVAAAGGDAAVLEHHDLVGQRDRREAVRDDDRRAALHDRLAARAGCGPPWSRRPTPSRRPGSARAGRRAAPARSTAAGAARPRASARARRRSCRSPSAAPR